MMMKRYHNVPIGIRDEIKLLFVRSKGNKIGKLNNLIKNEFMNLLLICEPS